MNATTREPLPVEMLATEYQRRPQKHIAEQFDLFPAGPARRYKASIIAGDEDDPAQTLVIDGTRDAEGGGDKP